MRWIVLERLGCKQGDRKDNNNPAANIILDAIALRLNVSGYLSLGPKLVRDAITSEWSLHLARTFFGCTIQDAGYRHSAMARRKMAHFQGSRLNFNNAKETSIFIWQLQSNEVFGMKLHRDYLLRPARLPDEEAWVEIPFFIHQAVQFLEGNRPNKGNWRMAEIQALVMYNYTYGDLRGLPQIVAERLGRTQDAVEGMIRQLHKDGLMPDVAEMRRKKRSLE